MPDIFPSPAQRAGATVRVACMQSQRLPQRSWIHWRRRDDECKVYVMENTLTMDENWGHPSILFKEASICTTISMFGVFYDVCAHDVVLQTFAWDICMV